MSEGGWQAVQSDQTEPENVALPFPCGVFPPMLEQYLDSAAENVQVDRAMIGAANAGGVCPVFAGTVQDQLPLRQRAQ